MDTPPSAPRGGSLLLTSSHHLFCFEPILFRRSFGAATLLPKSIGKIRNVLLRAVFYFKFPFRFSLNGTGGDDCGSAHGDFFTPWE